jgi:hypothetical protein
MIYTAELLSFVAVPPPASQTLARITKSPIKFQKLEPNDEELAMN